MNIMTINPIPHQFISISQHWINKDVKHSEINISECFKNYAIILHNDSEKFYDLLYSFCSKH